MQRQRRLLLSAVLVLTTAVTASAYFGANAPAGAAARANTEPIVDLDADFASRPIEVVGAAGVVEKVSVTLHGLNHAYPDDLDVYLRGPNFVRVLLMSDVCGTSDLTDIDLSFADDAPTHLSNAGDCPAGSYRPTNVDAFGDKADSLQADATTLAAFDQINPNGEWDLYVYDDEVGDAATIEGWTLRIETGPWNIRIGETATANPYPRAVSVADARGTIADLDIRLTGLWHRNPRDIDVLVVGPGGQSAVLMSDACGAADAAGTSLTFSDEAAAPVDGGGFNCADGEYQPTDNDFSGDSDDVFPAPAPSPPHGSTLSVFDGTNPNGTWRFFVVDDYGRGDGGFRSSGFLVNPPQLIFTLDTTLKCRGVPVNVDLSSGHKPTPGPDVILGTEGTDTIHGLGGDDLICGQGGNDTIQGGRGNDTLDGGTGRDLLSYAATSQQVEVFLSVPDPQNTGPATGTDTIAGFEDLSGGAGNDFLVGDDSDNRIYGRAGNDLIGGQGGTDDLHGGAGNDTCDGGDGVDTSASCETRSTLP